MSVYILGIESSCDDTSAAVIKDNKILANVIAGQEVHRQYGGVVPELASRAHQQNIIPVVHQALQKAKIDKKQLHAIAFTRGPGLLGSLLVGVSFAKTMAMGLDIPLIEVDHMHGHILAHFIDEPGKDTPAFPFLCLTVSGGHTQITQVNDFFDMQVIGRTIDDAAGETFDKAAKIMSLPYPGGPVIDRCAREGDAQAFSFPKPRVKELDYSFSGLKTSFLYFLRDRLKENAAFIEQNKNDLCASIQDTIIRILMDKLTRASEETGIRRVAVAGGVSANSGLRDAVTAKQASGDWEVYIPRFAYCTDNAAMIAITGYYKYINGMFGSYHVTPYARSR